MRELINVVRRKLAMSRRNLLSVEDMPEDVRAKVGAETTSPAEGQEISTQSGFLGERARMLSDIECDYYMTMLRSCNGDISATARIAKVSRQTVYRALDRLNIDPNDFRDEDSVQG